MVKNKKYGKNETIRQKELEQELCQLLEHVENTSKVNDVKSKKISQLTEEIMLLKREMIGKETNVSSIVYAMDLKCSKYAYFINQLVQQNISLENKLQICRNYIVEHSIFLLCVLIVCPAMFMTARQPPKSKSVTDEQNQWKHYELMERNEFLLSEINSLNHRIANRVALKGDNESHLQMVRDQLRFVTNQNQYLLQNQEESVLAINRLNVVISDLKIKLDDAYNDVHRLKIIDYALADDTAVDSVNILSFEDTMINSSQTYAAIISVIVVLLAIIGLQFVIYRLYQYFQNLHLPQYSLQKKTKKKWNRGLNGRLSSTFSNAFKLSRSG